MMKLVALRISALTMLAFGDLIQVTLKLLKPIADKAEAAPFNLHLAALIKEFELYQEAIKKLRISEETAVIARLDTQRDQDLQAVFSSIKPYKNSRRPAEKEAYDKMNLIFKNYKTAGVHSYSQQTLLVNKLLAELGQTEIQKLVNTLVLNKFIRDLTDSQKAFEKAYDSRQKAETEDKTLPAKELRKSLSERYKLLCQSLYNLAYLHQKGELDCPEALVLLDGLNQARKEQVENLKRASSKTKVKESEIPTE